MREIPIPTSTSNATPQRRGVHEIINAYSNSGNPISQATQNVSVHVAHRTSFRTPQLNTHGGNRASNTGTPRETNQGFSEQQGLRSSGNTVFTNPTQGRNMPDIPIHPLSPPREPDMLPDFHMTYDHRGFLDNHTNSMEERRSSFEQRRAQSEHIPDHINHLTPPNSSSSSTDMGGCTYGGNRFSHYTQLTT